MQAYSNPKRESDPHALPDIEVWHVGRMGPRREVECRLCSSEYDDIDPPEAVHLGWYWQPCFPGCLPDSDPPFGPFGTRDEALADAREGMDDEDEA